MKRYFVYIMSNRFRTIYTGMTNNLERRVYEHKHKVTPGFTSKYNTTGLSTTKKPTASMSQLNEKKRSKIGGAL